MKGERHEIHRNSNETPEERQDSSGDQRDDTSETGSAEKIQKWYRLIVPQVEEDFAEIGRLEEWYAKLWTVSQGDDKDKFYYVPILESQEKLAGHLEAVKNVAKKVKADAALAVYKRIHMAHDEKSEFDVKNQESIELLFETFGFCRRYVWDIARESGKLPWLINGREDPSYVGGNLLDFIDLG